MNSCFLNPLKESTNMCQREDFIQEVIKSVEQGKSFKKFQEMMGKRYGLNKNVVYQRYTYLVKQLEKELSSAKTVRKSKLRKIYDKVVFNKPVVKVAESVIQTLERITARS